MAPAARQRTDLSALTVGQILSGWQVKLEAQRAIFEGEANRVLTLEHSVHGGFSIVAALAKDVRELEGAQERLDRDLEAMETAQGQMGETLDLLERSLKENRGSGGGQSALSFSSSLSGGGLGAGLAAYGQTASDRVLALPGLFGAGAAGRGGAVSGSDAMSSRAAAAEAATRVDALLAELGSDVRLLVAAANEEFSEARNDPLEEVRRSLDEQMRALESVHRQAHEAILRAARTEALLTDVGQHLHRVPEDTDRGAL